MGVGYAAASIERIAVAANVSKVTIYNRFQNKENLFSVVIGNECVKMRCEIQEICVSEYDLRQRLLDLATSMMSFLSGHDVIRLDRGMAAEVERYPGIGELFLDSGPRRLQLLISQIIDRAMQDGYLILADPKQAAAHLYGLVKGFADIEWRFSDADKASESLDRTSVEVSVDRFLAAYSP